MRRRVRRASSRAAARACLCPSRATNSRLAPSMRACTCPSAATTVIATAYCRRCSGVNVVEVLGRVPRRALRNDWRNDQIDSRSAFAAACRRSLTSASSRAAMSMRSCCASERSYARSARCCWLSARSLVSVSRASMAVTVPVRSANCAAMLAMSSSTVTPAGVYAENLCGERNSPRTASASRTDRGVGASSADDDVLRRGRSEEPRLPFHCQRSSPQQTHRPHHSYPPRSGRQSSRR